MDSKQGHHFCNCHQRAPPNLSGYTTFTDAESPEFCLGLQTLLALKVRMMAARAPPRGWDLTRAGGEAGGQQQGPGTCRDSAMPRVGRGKGREEGSPTEAGSHLFSPLSPVLH